jgi:hypothetical protein
MAKRFRAYPIGRHYANELIVRWHRHHGPVAGFKAAWVALETERPCGVATLARPKARMIDAASTLEVTRLATDGTPHACSFLYGVACREARRTFGATRVITYILADEPGTSLHAAGFRQDGITEGGPWSRPSRPANDVHPLGRKQRWVRVLAPREQVTA